MSDASRGVSLHLHPGREAQDREVVREVLDEDGYRLAAIAGLAPLLREAELTVVDIGGHIGTFAVACAHHLPHLRVIACEPAAASAELYRRNLIACGIAGAVETCALHYGAETVTLLDHPHATACAMVTTSDDGSPDALGMRAGENHLYRIEHPAVPALTLEALMERHRLERIDLLKLDCEGGEIGILAGMLPATMSGIGAIVGEYHSGSEPIAELARRRFAGWRLSIEPIDERFGNFLLAPDSRAELHLAWLQASVIAAAGGRQRISAERDRWRGSYERVADFPMVRSLLTVRAGLLRLLGRR